MFETAPVEEEVVTQQIEDEPVTQTADISHIETKGIIQCIHCRFTTSNSSSSNYYKFRHYKLLYMFIIFGKTRHRFGV